MDKNENLKTLTMDNGACNNDQKLSVTSSIEHFEYLAKQYFNWRTPTKQYKTIFERVMGLGSSKYDEFILYCYNLGYISMQPMLNDEYGIEVIESYIIPDFANSDTKEMNIYLENYPRRETIQAPNATDLYNTIVEWVK